MSANLIQGEAGTTVTLEVLGEDGAARTVEVERAHDPVESRMLEGKVGYVRLLDTDHSAPSGWRRPSPSSGSRGRRRWSLTCGTTAAAT